MKTLIKSGDNAIRTNEEKQEIIKAATHAYGDFLTALGYDWKNDVNQSETPHRVAKMMVNEICHGNYNAPPKITVFTNENHYDGMVFQGDIDVKSLCSHHMLGFFGKAHVAYLPNPDGKYCGLSKLNRVVDYFARRPQVQENLTQSIHDFLSDLIPDNRGVAVVIEAQHTCVSLRGVNQSSRMKTSKLSGAFKSNPETREEFYDFIRNLDKR